MSNSKALQVAPLDADRARLRVLLADCEARERELDALKQELHALQARYLEKLGGLYAELNRLEADVADEEIRRGLRPPPEDDEPDPDDAGPRGTEQDVADQDGADRDGEPGHAGDGANARGGGHASPHGCGNHAAPSDGLKRVFRDLAKAVHPDRAPDERARFRRHSLMAEANRAYAERDEDRLRLILHTWQRSADAVVGDDEHADRQRLLRATAEAEARLAVVAAERADLQASAIARLKTRIDEAQGQGWDLFAEMILQNRREIAIARARLTSLRQSRPV